MWLWVCVVVLPHDGPECTPLSGLFLKTQKSINKQTISPEESWKTDKPALRNACSTSFINSEIGRHGYRKESKGYKVSSYQHSFILLAAGSEWAVMFLSPVEFWILLTNLSFSSDGTQKTQHSRFQCVGQSFNWRFKQQLGW